MRQTGHPSTGAAVLVEGLDLAAYTIPTETPESDGTLEWTSTTLVAVEVHAGGRRGFGSSYAPPAAALLARERTGPPVLTAAALGGGVALGALAVGAWRSGRRHRSAAAGDGARKSLSRSGIGL